MENNMTITDNFVHFHHGLWSSNIGERHILSRLHSKMPPIKETSRQTVFLAPDMKYSIAWDPQQLSYAGVMIRSHQPGEDQNRISFATLELPSSGLVSCTITNKNF